MAISGVIAAFEERPVAVALELGSLAVSVLLLVGVVVALATGPPGRPGGIWLAVTLLGAGFVCFWVVCWPLYERLWVPRSAE